jgi:hypothetical protein
MGEIRVQVEEEHETGPYFTNKIKQGDNPVSTRN